jgi:hypothetical protein
MSNPRLTCSTRHWRSECPCSVNLSKSAQALPQTQQIRASVTSDTIPTPPRASASQRALPQARAPRPRPQTAAVPLTPSFRPASPTPTWPCTPTMRPPTDSRQLILILLASPSRLRRACTPAPCSQLGLPRLRPVPVNQRVLRAHHYPLRGLRKEWFLITGTPLPRRTQCHHRVAKALQCSRAKPNRRITSSTHLPRLPVILRIGRHITLGRRRRRQRAIRPRRIPDLLLLPSAPVRSHPASRRRLKLETRARTAWRHREENNYSPFGSSWLSSVYSAYCTCASFPTLCSV